FFLDCCRVRELQAMGLPCTIGWPKPAGPAGLTRTFVAYATEFQNQAREHEGAGGETPVRGYFTRALLRALRGDAAQAAGGVKANDLKEYLEREIPRIANDDGHNQRPEVNNGLAAGSLFGQYQPNAPTVTIQLTGQRQGAIILEGPDLTVIGQQIAPLPPG